MLRRGGEVVGVDEGTRRRAKTIRHVIFDEVHSVGLPGGEKWERLLLYTSGFFSYLLLLVRSFSRWVGLGAQEAC